MKHVAVQSSNVASLAYDDDDFVLQVKFISGGIYEYQPVERDLYDRLIKGYDDNGDRVSVGNAIKLIREAVARGELVCRKLGAEEIEAANAAG